MFQLFAQLLPLELQGVDLELPFFAFNNYVLVLFSPTIVLYLRGQILDQLFLCEHRLSLLLEALADVRISFKMELDVLGRTVQLLDLLLDRLERLQLLVSLRTLELIVHELLDLFLHLNLLQQFVVPLSKLLDALWR